MKNKEYNALLRRYLDLDDEIEKLELELQNIKYLIMNTEDEEE